MSTQVMDGYTHDLQLRARIQAFSPDEPGVVFPFSTRLARENGWPRPFAERVVEEYLRFVYLAMTAGHPVTPSVQVDQAWHLHLTYTQSYWERMCGEVLGRPLHHGPTKGGREEGSKFNDWYARTLDSYRRAFGHAPPPDLWPPPAERFAPAARIRQVSDATYWVIRKPRLRRGPLTAAVAFCALFAAAACTAEQGAAAWVIGAVLPLAAVLIWPMLAGASEPGATRRHREDGSGAESGLVVLGGGDMEDGDAGDGGGDSGDGGGGDGGGGCGGCGGCGG